MSSITEIDALKEIQRIATQLLRNTQPQYTESSSSNPTSLYVPPLNFNDPIELLSPIHRLDMSENIRQQILQYIDRRIDELQRHYTTAYEQACHATYRFSSNFDLTIVRRVYETRFQSRCFPMLEGLVSQIETQVAAVNERNLCTNSKRPFNNDFIPVLEKYFEYNGYPTVAHRSVLANKSRMTPRQIEVWFQNHRNRAKKDGQIVRRLNSDMPLQQALNLLPSQTACRQNYPQTPPYDESTSDLTKEADLPVFHSTETTQASVLDSIDAHRPSHAFPTTRSASYPDPFPSNNGVFTFPSPVWMRKPATETIIETSVDMDDFTRTFHLKLNFSEHSRRPGVTPPKSETPSQPWFSATTTFPGPAPHPALVRTSLGHQPSISSLPAPSSRPLFGSISLSVPPTLLPLAPDLAPRRKIKPLPRRIPGQFRSHPFGSRISSFDSDTSSGSRSSSSNCSSSPELSTPPPLPPSDLPTLQIEGQQSFFDLSLAELDSDFSLSNFLHSEDFSFTNIYPTIGKIPDIPFLDNTFCHNLAEIL